MTNPNLDKIVPILAKVVDGQNLTAQESEKVFTNIFLYDKEGYHLATIIAAIHAKGETADELLGFVNTYRKLGARINSLSSDKLIDLSGTGGGTFKTINVSTTASFIVAAAGYKVAKEAFYGVTSPTGSADIFLAFGIDIRKISKNVLEKTIKKVGICPYFGSFLSPSLANINQIDRKIFVDKRLHIRSPFHLATNIYSPALLKYRIYGCYSEKYLEVLGELFSKLGYERSLVFYGYPGIPEISNVGKTIVVEQNGKKFKKYILTPSSLGIRRAKPEDIKTGGKEQNIIDFLRILQGKERGPKADLAAINAAAAFYVLGESETIASSVPKALGIIKSGEGFRILERLVQAAGQPKLLQAWLTKI